MKTTTKISNYLPKRFSYLLFLSLIFIGFNKFSYGQTTLYTQNFGTGTSFPTGWSAAGSSTWTISTANASTTPTFSGGSNLASGSANGNRTVTFNNNLSTVGYTNITILWGARRAHTNTVTCEWSINGTTWNALTFTDVANNSTWAWVNSGTRISLPAGAAGASNLRIRWTYNSNGTAGRYRIDDFSVEGTGPSYSIPFTQSFDGTTFPPSYWGLVNAGYGNNWARTTTTPYAGAGVMTYTYNSTYAANTWAFTPGCALQAGNTYQISFYQKVESATYPEKLKVTVGTSATVAGQTTTLWNNAGGASLTNTTYALRTATYSCITTGNYYFAFNCYSDADMWILYVDEVAIQVAIAHDVAPIALMNPTRIPENLHLPWLGTVKNYGTNTETFNVDATLRENSVISSTSTSNVSSLTSGSSSNISGYFDLSALGTGSTFDLALETQLASDQNTGNDLLTNYTRACTRDSIYAWDDGVAEGSVGYNTGTGWLGQLYYFSSQSTLSSITVNWGTIPGALSGNSLEIFNVSGGVPSAKFGDIVTGISLSSADQGIWKTYSPVSPIVLPAGTYWIGAHQSSALSGTYIISDDQSGFTADNFMTGLCYYSSNGTTWVDYVSSGLYMVNLIRPNFTILTSPSLSAVPGSLDFGFTQSGTLSAEQSFAISGSNLTVGPIVVNAPAGFEISLSSGSGFSSSVNVNYIPPTLGSTTIFVRFAPTGSPAVYSGSITNVGGGASVNVPVTGTSILTYCNSNFSNVTYEFISNVTFAGINNSSAGNTGVPVDYTSLVAEVVQGGTYPISVTIDPDVNDYIYAFIDWNLNGVLNNAGEVYTIAADISTAGPHTIDIIVPETATLGNIRMRVMVDWNNAIPDPCRSATYGEAEDYTVHVSCAAPEITVQPSNSNITYGDPASFSVTATNAYSYQWEEYTTSWTPLSNSGIYSNVTTQTLNISKATVSMSGYKYRCVVTSDCNSTVTTNGNATLSITPKFLTVAADTDQFKYFGQSDPVFTYNASGFVTGEDEGVLSGLLSRFSGETVGIYTITIGTLSAVNYSINFTAANFEIKPAYQLNLTVFLQSSYQTGTGLMSTVLNSSLSANQPFNTSPWNYFGTETLPTPLSPDAVDWVLVELRSDEYTMFERKAGLIYKDGSIQVSFTGSSPAGNYVVIWHRSHMPVMSHSKVPLPIEGASINLSLLSNLYGNESNPAINLGGGVYGMILGDVTQNGLLKYSGAGNDRGPIFAKIIEVTGSNNINGVTPFGYWQEDVSMNGIVSYIGSGNDRSPILANLGYLIGTPYLNNTYTSVVPGVYTGGGKEGSNEGPVDIRFNESFQQLDIELVTKDLIEDGLIDNIQFTLAWNEGDSEIESLINSFTSDFNLQPQGEPIMLDGNMHLAFVSITPTTLAEQWNPGDAVTVLSFEKQYGVNIGTRLWIADNDFTAENNGEYFVSNLGSDVTGMYLSPMVGVSTPNEAALRIYPNPVFSGNLYIEMNTLRAENFEISVWDMTGKLVKKINENAISGSSIGIIDVSDFNPGMYIIHLKLSDNDYKERFVIK